MEKERSCYNYTALNLQALHSIRFLQHCQRVLQSCLEVQSMRIISPLQMTYPHTAANDLFQSHFLIDIGVSTRGELATALWIGEREQTCGILSGTMNHDHEEGSMIKLVACCNLRILPRWIVW